MRSSTSGVFHKRGPHADRRLLVFAVLFVACACAMSYVAGLNASTCKVTAIVRHSPLHHDHATPTPDSTSLQALKPANATPQVTQQPTAGNSEPPVAHAPTGRHILLEYYRIPRHLFAPLTNTQALSRTVTVLIQQAGMTYLAHACHVFGGSHGVTCMFLLAESHVSLHTWPEHGYAALDVFTCGASARPEVLEQGLRELLQPELVVRQQHHRGGLNLSELTPEQRAAKVLHTFATEPQEGENLQQLLYQVPVLHSSHSRYQSLTVVDVPGQLGRCLLLDYVIQFCSYDLDAYTDHMARHPLQLLQAVQGCQPPDNLKNGLMQRGSASGSSIRKENAAAAAAASVMTSTDALTVATPEMPLAASSSTPGRITCRKSLLQLPQESAAATAAAAATTNSATETTSGVQCGALQRKLRVLLVGGGDGWIAGHLISCYGDLVDTVTAVELDQAVSNVTQQHFADVMMHGSPFSNARIRWEYTDAYAWAVQRAQRCSAVQRYAGNNTDYANSSSIAAATPANAASAETSARSTSPLAASAQRHLDLTPGAASSGNADARRHALRTSSASSTSDPAHEFDCAEFDVVIIDSTDFTVEAASQLHSAPFYAALHQLMSPQAALIQIVEIYMRIFEQDFATMENALRAAGWEGVGRSSVFVPSYGGEALMLHAVKR